MNFAKFCKVSYPISVRDNAIKWVWSCVFAAPNINQACTEGPTMVAPLSTYERKQALQMFHIHTMYIYIYCISLTAVEVIYIYCISLTAVEVIYIYIVSLLPLSK